jgi:hypothetical protein
MILQKESPQGKALECKVGLLVPSNGGSRMLTRLRRVAIKAPGRERYFVHYLCTVLSNVIILDFHCSP